jgi:pimeloyl-ACP methyl ester carboxylesterase
MPKFEDKDRSVYKIFLAGLLATALAFALHFLPRIAPLETPSLSANLMETGDMPLTVISTPTNSETLNFGNAFNGNPETEISVEEAPASFENNNNPTEIALDSDDFEVEKSLEFKVIEALAEEPSVESVSNSLRTRQAVLKSRTKVTTFSPTEVNQLARRFYSGYSYEPAQYSVEKWSIRFETRHENNTLITGNALVYVPIGDGPFPILGSAAGTTGIDDACAPSRENVRVANWGDYEGYHAAFAGQGYAVVFPDYSGFNDTDGLHHYFVADLQAKVVLDSLKALRNMAAQINLPLEDKIFLSGYSQGAHSILAAADIWKTYAPELPISGLITYGAANHTIDLIRFNSHLGPYLIYAYEDLYGTEVVNRNDLLQPRFAQNLEQDHLKCVGDVGNYYGYDGSRVYSDALWYSLTNNSLAADFPQFHEALSKNISGYGDWQAPTLILQGATDRITPPEQNRRMLERLCSDNKPTTYRELASTNHVFTRQRSFNDTLTWIEAVNSGENFPNSCDTL